MDEPEASVSWSDADYDQRLTASDDLASRQTPSFDLLPPAGLPRSGGVHPRLGNGDPRAESEDAAREFRFPFPPRRDRHKWP